MNFIYSFREKPKQIFLVHGDGDSQEVLKEKIEQDANLPVIISNFGETYELKDEVELISKIDRKSPITKRVEVLNRLDKLKDEILDMDALVRDDMNNKDLKDEDIFRINEKIKDLEKQILKVIEG